MAIIPQFRADGPAMAQAPALEQERSGIRLNASGELAELGGLAQRLARGNRPLDTLPLGLGGGVAQGISAIGDGVKSVGQAIFNIQERAAEARNYRAVHEAQSAMDREAGEFEKWKVQNANRPELWEAEWNNRVRSFGDNYTSGKDLSPAAKEGINLRLNSFAESQAVRVGVDSVKAQANLAREAIDADYYRAIEAGDAETAISLSRYGFEQGFIPEDVAARMEIGAVDAVENKALEVLGNNVSADVAEGNFDLAIERTAQNPSLREDEKRARIAGITKQKIQVGVVDEAKQVGFVDPVAGVKMLKEVDENGQYKNWPEMSAEARYGLEREFRGMDLEYQTQALKGVIDRASTEGLSEGGLYFDEGFKELPANLKQVVIERVKKGALEDLMEFSNFSDKVRSLDARTADGREEAERLKQEAIARFSGETREAALQGIQTRIENPKPLMPDDEAITMARSMVKDRFENEEFGRFKFAKADIIEREISVNGEKTGEIGYFVNDPAPPEGFGYRERYERLWGTKLGKDPYRRIKLTPDQEREFKTAKPDKVFIDDAFRQTVGKRMIDSVEVVERKKEAGEYSAATDYLGEMSTLMGISNKEAFDRRAAQISTESGLPPAGVGTGGALFPPALRPAGDPRELLNSLGNATGY